MEDNRASPILLNGLHQFDKKTVLLVCSGKPASFLLEDDKDVVNKSRRMCNVVLRRRRVECQVTPEYLTDAHGSTICVVNLTNLIIEHCI